MTSLRWVIPILILPEATLSAQAGPDPQAVAAIHGLVRIGGFVKDWCDARAPETKEITDAGQAGWRRTFKLDEVEVRFASLDGDNRRQVDAAIEGKRTDVYRGLDRASRDPAGDCRKIEQYLGTEVNPEKLYPKEYTLALRPGTSAIGSDGSASKMIEGSTSGGSTVYTVSQLSALAVNADRTRQTSKRVLTSLGTLVVTGTLEKYDASSEVAFLNTKDDAWRSRYGITCYDLSLARLYDRGTRSLVLQGQVRDVYGTIIQLEECHPLPTNTPLTPAALADRGGAVRFAVEAKRVMTAPGRGLAMNAIEGLVWNGAGRTTVTGYQFEEKTYLLLKDGWLYDNLQFTPADLDVAASRRLEPQHWAEWKRQGNGLVIRRRDEWDQPASGWQPLVGDFKAPLGPRTSLSGRFEMRSAATLGGVAFGTTSTSTTAFTFAPDGRYQYYSASLTTGNSNVGTGDNGSSGTATSGNAAVSFGQNGVNTFAQGSHQDEGTYAIDGYTLEFRSAKGRVTRAFAFPWDSAKYKNHLVIGGVTYTSSNDR